MSYPRYEKTSKGEGEGEEEAHQGSAHENQARELGEGEARPEEAEGIAGESYSQAESGCIGSGQSAAARESGEGPSGPKKRDAGADQVEAEEDNPGPVSEAARRVE